MAAGQATERFSDNLRALIMKNIANKMKHDTEVKIISGCPLSRSQPKNSGVTPEPTAKPTNMKPNTLPV